MKNLNDVLSGVDDVLNSAKLGNFEEVLAKTKNYAEIATKKSAERLEISRKKIELLDSKTKLSKAYEKYGKLAFLKSEGEEVDEEEFSSCTAEIQLQKTRTEMLDAEITQLKEIFTQPISKREEKSAENEADAPEVEVEIVEPTE